MFFAWCLAGSFLSIAVSAANQELLVDGTAAMLFEGGAVGLLQMSSSNVYKPALDGNATVMESSRAVAGANASLATATAVVDAVMETANMVTRMLREAPERNQVAFVVMSVLSIAACAMPLVASLGRVSPRKSHSVFGAPSRMIPSRLVLQSKLEGSEPSSRRLASRQNPASQ
mmetsp:Transcript_1281/g.2996  ORF Transcript_1281/g.2996 Transcript_1281/m.2996 type:complete len:173 (+) Transcript_1281:107-625(+)